VFKSTFTKNNNLDAYLASLIEDDDFIYILKILRDNKGNKLRSQIEIEFVIEDLSLVKKNLRYIE